jgi:xanthine/CO dehydrogenase XdhC/CoxF family maturation factor
MSGFAELARAARLALDARPTVALALATLVEVEGSSYRQPGARLLVDAEQRVLAGAISGGCLEGDVATHAAVVCASGRAMTLRYDLRNDLETIWGFGSACDGVAHIVLEPLPDIAWLQAAAEIRTARTGGAVLTIARDEAGVGTAGLLRGAARDQEWERIGAMASSANVDFAHATPLADIAQRTAHAEHRQQGDVRWLVEPLMPVVSLVLIGAGRGAEAFAHIATTLGWDVTLIDHRPALLASLTLPDSVRVIEARADDATSVIAGDTRTAVALLSHIFDVDAAWLRRLQPLTLGYVGVLGSRQRAARLLELALDAPISASPARAIHAPIGLDLGGETPESIALAAVAEIEAVMHGRPGGFLRDRASPIHLRTPTPSLLSSQLSSALPTPAPAATESPESRDGVTRLAAPSTAS